MGRTLLLEIEFDSMFSGTVADAVGSESLRRHSVVPIGLSEGGSAVAIQADIQSFPGAREEESVRLISSD